MIKTLGLYICNAEGKLAAVKREGKKFGESFVNMSCSGEMIAANANDDADDDDGAIHPLSFSPILTNGQSVTITFFQTVR